MRSIFFILFLTAFFSCQYSLKKEREKYCEYLNKIALKEIEKGNIEPIIKTKYLYSLIDEYYIWKKYDVSVEYPIQINNIAQIEHDSCYNSIMMKYTPNIKDIIKELDSLSVLNRSHPRSKYIKLFNDGIYLTGLNASEKRYAPKRIDTTYYNKLDEFQAKFNIEVADTLMCGFWYEIDTFGQVQNIEIYHHANPVIDSAVIIFYSLFRYLPANDGKNKLVYRNKDSIFFLGTKCRTISLKR